MAESCTLLAEKLEPGDCTRKGRATRCSPSPIGLAVWLKAFAPMYQLHSRLSLWPASARAKAICTNLRRWEALEAGTALHALCAADIPWPPPTPRGGTLLAAMAACEPGGRCPGKHRPCLYKIAKLRQATLLRSFVSDMMIIRAALERHL